LVEAVEALTIILAVATVRGWRAANRAQSGAALMRSIPVADVSNLIAAARCGDRSISGYVAHPDCRHR
jgi:hypothetical protein